MDVGLLFFPGGGRSTNMLVFVFESQVLSSLHMQYICLESFF